MATLKKRMEENNCQWLDGYLKGVLNKKDLKHYNATKKLLYYFPTLVNGLTEDDFELAMKHPEDTYVCLNPTDIRYKVFDTLYMRKNGREFEPSSYGETRYVTIKEVCEI